MSPPTDRLQRVLDALRIHSLTRFELGDAEPLDFEAHGGRGIAPHPSAGSSPGEVGSETLFAAILQGHLYNMAYVREWPDGAPPLDANQAPPPDAALLARLRALRPDPVHDRGWQVETTRADGSAVLVKNGWRRTADAGRWGWDGDGDGGRAWVEVPAPHQDAWNTFVFLRGRTAGDGDEQGNLFRLYLHTRAEGAGDFLEALVRALDAQALPFTLKTLMAPAAAARADATVVYLSRRYYRAALDCLRHLPNELLEGLGEATPLFALPLRPGVAVAEDPPGGESFGMHRLRLVVESVLELWHAGEQDGRARRRAVETRFAAEGLSLEAPHLGVGSTLDYATPFESTAAASGSRKPMPSKPAAGNDLELAARIGARLGREALWHGDRCTWQGWAMMDRGRGDEFGWRALGPDLYRGTSGIALFLAHLHALTGDPGPRAPALAGLEQALAGIDDLDPGSCIGLHTGLAGIGHAAIEIGTLLGREDCIERGLDVLARIGEVELEPSIFDVVSGAAGCVPVLLSAAERHGRPELLELAVRLGDFLVEQARPMPTIGAAQDDGARAWGMGEGPPLCGFSHGAAGVALALADLHAATGDGRYAAVARAGLAYERRHYRPAARNWLDLRSTPGTSAGAEGASPASALAWCHGAPGMALARLGLLETLPESDANDNGGGGDDVRATVEAELEIALDTTARHLEAGLSTGELPLGNISFCHGAFGNADVLLLAARRRDRPELEEIARAIGELARRRIEGRGLPWPSGNPGAHPTPGLMLGDAGAGHYYLRLHDPEAVPSALWVRPTSDRAGR